MGSDIHAGLAAYLASREIVDPAPDSDGVIVLNIGGLRVHCRRLAQGELLLDAHLRRLPAGIRIREELTMDALRFSAGRMRDRREVLVMMENGRNLRLQRRVPPTANAVAVEAELGSFATAVDEWSCRLGG